MVLLPRAMRDPAVLARAVTYDRPEFLCQALDAPANPKWAIADRELSAHVHEALLKGSFRAANALLDIGARVLCGTFLPRRSLCEGANVDPGSPDFSCCYLGSLALAARSGYHMKFWYKPSAQYSSEREFWKWKKRAMEKIVQQLRDILVLEVDGQGGLSSWDYQTELNLALIEAASSHAHSNEVIDFLLDNGADVNAETDSWDVGLVLFNALNEGRPSLFKSKVEYLLDQGVDVSRVRSTEGDQTPLQFLLTKLYRSCQYSSDSSTTIARFFALMDVLEDLGCLKWPTALLTSVESDEFDGINGSGGLGCVDEALALEASARDARSGLLDPHEPGVRELQMIFSDPDVSLQSLKEALWDRIT
ncbi:hypothetical protein CTAM01_16988 [Colletotrichum tamarilloi]|uniref:Ankyrin repeat protein n=1 Tax=Colletotrichum tamarilloi TaxID=1209934 RepID=A0ABQ9QGY0_9PEZI|nr:uncharacterized protein CTAM01_16988 [Colletotrichum tamarilloi]KAK1467811.1 hypothetical protein CTAM01_16988 [Colletotrichum tamarilloi]